MHENKALYKRGDLVEVFRLNRVLMYYDSQSFIGKKGKVVQVINFNHLCIDFENPPFRNSYGGTIFTFDSNEVFFH